MKELFESVENFHNMTGSPILKTPQIPSQDRVILREKLTNEESEEIFIGADNNDIVETIDGLIDLMWINVGNCIEFGVTSELFMLCWREVERSNMSKSVATYEEALVEKSIFRNKDIEVLIKEKNGRYILINKHTKKVLKPSTYFPAKLKPIIDKYVNEQTN